MEGSRQKLPAIVNSYFVGRVERRFLPGLAGEIRDPVTYPQIAPRFDFLNSTFNARGSK